MPPRNIRLLLEQVNTRAYASGGLERRAGSVRDQLDSWRGDRYVPPVALVTAYVPSATGDAIFALIDRAIEERDPMIRFFTRVCPGAPA